MHAVVSMLDDRHSELVERLWAELEREFGVRGIYSTPYPHFSYQVATDYAVGRLAAALEPVARAKAPFRVRTAGLGIFPGPRPVLFIPVVRTGPLSRFHQALWGTMAGCGARVQENYSPARWMPHITFGYGDLNPENLGAIVRYLSDRPLTWEIPVTNLALIYDTVGQQGLEFRLEFGGRKRQK